MAINHRKIMLSGPSGSGKTSLAKAISELYHLPLVQVSATNVGCKCRSITDHKSILDLQPSEAIRFQLELIYERGEAFIKEREFVSDRSLIDNLAYILLQNSMYASEREINMMISLIGNYFNKLRVQKGTVEWHDPLIIHVPNYFENPIEDNNKRITNRYYQQLSNKAFELAYELLDLPCLTIPNLDFNLEARLKYVEDHI